jgi:hypothetical protein
MVKSRVAGQVTDADIDRAIRRGKSYEKYAPRATHVAYRAKTDMLALTLASGVEIAIPRLLLQGLECASPREIADVEILGPGSMLHWPMLDVDHAVPSLIHGVFGTKRWMAEIGRRGGTATSAAKAAAARTNGRKGGRPRKGAPLA